LSTLKSLAVPAASRACTVKAAAPTLLIITRSAADCTLVGVLGKRMIGGASSARAVVAPDPGIKTVPSRITVCGLSAPPVVRPFEVTRRLPVCGTAMSGAV